MSVGTGTDEPNSAKLAAAPAPHDNPLSDREMEVARLLVTGVSNSQIARELVISPHTVKVHLRNVFEKLQVGSRTEASMVLLQRGWVSMPGVDLAPAALEEEAPVEPLPLAALPASIKPWQRVYLVGVIVVCLLALAAPRLVSQPQSSFSLLSDAGYGQTSKAEIQPEPRWEVRTPLASARSRLSAVLAGDDIYVIGGERAHGQTVDTVSAYDLRVNEWRPIAPLPEPLANVAAAALDGYIYVAGGSYNGQTDDQTIHVSDGFWRYDVEQGAWQELAALPMPLAGATMVADESSVYLIGGWDGESMRDEVWRYAPSDSGEDQNEWELATRLDTPRAFLGADRVGDEIYVIGGFDGEHELDLAASYDLRTGEWRQLPPLSVPRSGHSVVYDGLALFVLGGGWTHAIETHERFDPTTDQWSNFPSPIQGEWRNLGSVSHEGRIHLIGGWSGDYLDTHLQYQSTFRALLPIISNE